MKLPPYFFGIIYVASIFGFAWLYTTMPNEFYHSTVKYERTLYNDSSAIHYKLEQALKSSARKFQHRSELLKNDTLLIDEIEIQNLNIKKELVKFHFWGVSKSKRGLSFHRNNLIIFLDFNPFDTLNINGKIEDIVKICDYDNNPIDSKSLNISDMFQNSKWLGGGNNPPARDTTLRCYNCADCGTVILPDSLVKELVYYANSAEGFPSNSSGNFDRMFYLSAITITTVGFGDIVPITPRARIWISIEAIWGIIMIGLFLNSLATKLKIGKT